MNSQQKTIPFDEWIAQFKEEKQKKNLEPDPPVGKPMTIIPPGTPLKMEYIRRKDRAPVEEVKEPEPPPVIEEPIVEVKEPDPPPPAPPPKLTIFESKGQDILDDFDNNMLMTDIKRKYGIGDHYRLVAFLAKYDRNPKKRKVKYKKRPNNKFDIHGEEILAEFDEHQSMKQLKDKYKLQHKPLRNFLIKNGRQIRPSPKELSKQITEKKRITSKDHVEIHRDNILIDFDNNMKMMDIKKKYKLQHHHLEHLLHSTGRSAEKRRLRAKSIKETFDKKREEKKSGWQAPSKVKHKWPQKKDTN